MTRNINREREGTRSSSRGSGSPTPDTIYQDDITRHLNRPASATSTSRPKSAQRGRPQSGNRTRIHNIANDINTHTK